MLQAAGQNAPGLIAQQGLLPAAAAAAAAVPALSRGFAAGPAPEVIPNPLQKIVPPIIAGSKAAVAAAESGLKATADVLLNGAATQGAIAYFADTFLLSGTFVDPADLDIAKWAGWLADNGYTNGEGWATISKVAAGKLDAGSLSPADVEVLVHALQTTGNYDRELFEGFANIVKARFTEFETPGLSRLIAAFADNGHFDADLWDDVADSIAYCNHYLAPMNLSLSEIAGVFAAFAKYRVDRGDLFIPLSRGIFEDKLKALEGKEFGQVAGSLLSSFKTLEFWPDATEAILVEAKLRPPGSLSPSEQAIAAEVEAKLRSYTGGPLPWLDGGYKDEEHFHGGAFGQYNLWVARDDLFPQYYKPSDVKVLKEVLASSK